MDTETFIQRLPKTETHLHLEGALPWDLLQEANPGKYPQPPASWQRDFVFRDFAHFEGELLGYAGDFFNSPERYAAAVRAVFARQLSEGVRYCELSFASGCIDFMELDGRAVADAIRAAAPPELEVCIFLGIHHSGYTEKMAPVLEDALTWENLDGIDLHGAEDEPLGDWAPAYWQRARQAGNATKAHAGEFCGADFVRWAIDALGVRRIQHGVRAVEDPALVRHLAEAGIVLDVCPISNVKLGVTSDGYHFTPIRQLVDAGVACTISTDDPISFGNNLLDEYRVLAEAGFTQDELAAFARNGFNAALVPEEKRAEWLAELNAFCQ